MISKADPKAQVMLSNTPMTLVNDMNAFMTGQTISYAELCQGLIMSKSIAKEIYDPAQSTKLSKFDALKEIALEAAP